MLRSVAAVSNVRGCNRELFIYILSHSSYIVVKVTMGLTPADAWIRDSPIYITGCAHVAINLASHSFIVEAAPRDVHSYVFPSIP